LAYDEKIVMRDLLVAECWFGFESGRRERRIELITAMICPARARGW
jgi:hypothetical protein